MDEHSYYFSENGYSSYDIDSYDFNPDDFEGDYWEDASYSYADQIDSYDYDQYGMEYDPAEDLYEEYNTPDEDVEDIDEDVEDIDEDEVAARFETFVNQMSAEKRKVFLSKSNLEQYACFFSHTSSDIKKASPSENSSPKRSATSWQTQKERLIEDYERYVQSALFGDDGDVL